MNSIYTSHDDEQLIALVKRKGLLMPDSPKWRVLRVALALSLKQSTPPDETLDKFDRAKGGEYSLDILTGRSQNELESFVDSFYALLSVYHKQDLFADDKLFAKFLQRHIRRGLKEIETSWREAHDFHEFLRQAFFSTLMSKLNIEETIKNKVNDNNLINELTKLGLKADLLESIDGPRVTRYTIRLIDSADYVKLERKLENLGFSLGIKDAGIFLSPAGEPRIAWLDIPRPIAEWKSIGVETIINHQFPKHGLPVMLGVDIIGKPIVRDLVQAPHLMLAGTTGSGKSVCLHSILLSLLTTRDPNDLKLLAACQYWMRRKIWLAF